MPTLPTKQPASLTRARAVAVLASGAPLGGEYPLHKRELAWCRARVADGVAGTVGEILRKVAYRRPYSWRADRKASRECIKWAVRRALADKMQAHAVTPEREARACEVSVQGWSRDRETSLLALARSHINYLRMRAFMEGAYRGYPCDRPMTDRWNRLNPHARRDY